jgi:hypothetical protein
MSAEPDELDFPDVLPEVRARYGVAASYHRLWCLAVEGQVPARRVGKRWRVLRADLPRVAAALGAALPAAA